MKITTNHEYSLHGVPVMLDDEGNVLSQVDGLNLFLDKTKLKKNQLASLCGVATATCYGWGQEGKTIPASALNVMQGILEELNN